MSKVIGLDLSTSVAGFAIFEDGELTKYDYLKFKKEKDWDHIDLVDQFIEDISPELEGVDMIVLEDSLKRYAGGFSSNKSITVLLQFNAIITYLLRRNYGKDKVIHLHPSTARKAALGRGRSPKGRNAKEWVLDEISQRFDIEWPRTRYDNIRSECEDMADAIVLGTAYLNEQKEK